MNEEHSQAWRTCTQSITTSTLNHLPSPRWSISHIGRTASQLFPMHQTSISGHVSVTFTSCPVSCGQETWTQRCYTAARSPIHYSRDVPSGTHLHPNIPNQYSSFSVKSPGYVQGEGPCLVTPAYIPVLLGWSDDCISFLPSCDLWTTIAHFGTL